ncbi:hypothetical protein LguiA_029514 [Lonicera macranthoides]
MGNVGVSLNSKGCDARRLIPGLKLYQERDKRHSTNDESIMFNWANDIMISGLTSINSQLMHLVINSCNNVMVSNVKIIAPDNSPNIDGIHVQGSTGVTIKGCNIRTGDDCVSIGPGTSGLWMERIKCGPRHGTSGVKISDVTYKNIVGTLATKVAVTFDCSPTTPCSSIMLQDVKLDYLNNAAQSLCKNIRGSTRGVIKPNKHEKDSEREKVKESKHQEEFKRTICMKKLAASAKIIIVLPALSHPQYQGFCGSGGAHLDLGRIHGFCFLKRYLCAAFRAHDISTSSGCFIVSEGVASIKTMGPCLRGVIPSYNHHHQHLLILGVFQPPARWDSFTTLSCMTYENHGDAPLLLLFGQLLLRLFADGVRLPHTQQNISRNINHFHIISNVDLHGWLFKFHTPSQWGKVMQPLGRKSEGCSSLIMLH